MTSHRIPHGANVWSDPVKDLSGRVCVDFEDLKPGLRHALYVELKNHAVNPVAITNLPRLHAELRDSLGQPIPTSGLTMSGPTPASQWAVVPRDAYVGFRIDMQTVGVPTRAHGKALLAVGGRAWELTVGNYVLNVTAVFEYQQDGPQNQWSGEIVLPPTDVVVTTQMLAPM